MPPLLEDEELELLLLLEEEEDELLDDDELELLLEELELLLLELDPLANVTTEYAGTAYVNALLLTATGACASKDCVAEVI